MIVGGVLRIGSRVEVTVGIVVEVGVGRIGVCVAVGVNIGVSVCAGGVGCVDVVVQAERVRLIAKKREKSFFIVLLVDGIILPSDHGQSSMVHCQKGIL